MTRKIDEFVYHETSDVQFEVAHRARPKSLAEQDAEWARQERIQSVRAARVANRGRP